MSSSTDVGIVLPRNLPAEQVLPFARRADELGFDELWVVEDLGYRGGIAQAAAVLAVTDRIRVGIGILPTAVRSVMYSAMELTTLTELFGDRLVAGLGHGMPDWMRAVGVWPASPLTLLDEYATALGALLRGEEVAVEGRYVRLREVGLEMVSPVVPLVLGGVRGPKSLALAGRVLDGAILAEPVTEGYLASTREHLGAGEHRIVAYNVAAVDDDPAAARGRVRPALEWIGEPDWALHIASSPFAAEFAAHRASSVDRTDFAARLPDEWVDELAVVGTPDAARARIAALHAAGADSVVLIPAGDAFAELENLARALPAR